MKRYVRHRTESGGQDGYTYRMRESIDNIARFSFASRVARLQATVHSLQSQSHDR